MVNRQGIRSHDSFIVENRRMTTDQAEDRVERQAREFELLKPYLVERWAAVPA